MSDVPLSLPEFANGSTVNPKRYSSVLQRSEQDGIGFEDVDTLQLELEALLSATVVRKLTLKEEIKVLANVDRYKGTNKSYKKVYILSKYMYSDTMIFQRNGMYNTC